MEFGSIIIPTKLGTVVETCKLQHCSCLMETGKLRIATAVWMMMAALADTKWDTFISCNIDILTKNLDPFSFCHFPWLQTHFFHLKFQIPSSSTSTTYVLVYVGLVCCFSRILYPVNSAGKSSSVHLATSKTGLLEKKPDCGHSHEVIGSC